MDPRYAFILPPKGWEIHGIDNNQRAVFFGPKGDTRWNQQRLEHAIKGFVHHELDIRDRQGILDLVKQIKPDAIVHTAAQPSHDLAASIPFARFRHQRRGHPEPARGRAPVCPEVALRIMSTNKVYGDAPNELRAEGARNALGVCRRRPTGMAFRRPSASTSRSIRSSAPRRSPRDVMVQEYGRYFGMPTCALRGGCLTGPSHSGVELHGFLSYLIKCNLTGREYNVYGYKGKQVRDNIHSLDVARFIAAFVANPRAGEVYNIGGGRANSCSILEAFTQD